MGCGDGNKKKIPSFHIVVHGARAYKVLARLSHFADCKLILHWSLPCGAVVAGAEKFAPLEDFFVEKYVDVPRIMKWNTMVMEKEAASGVATGVTLNVKHSVANGDYVRAFCRNSIELHHLKKGEAVEKDAQPNDELSRHAIRA